jgi:histidine ammonia-lyase
MELKKVFRNMKQQQEDNPPPAASAKSEELHEYFAEVLPTYDRDRVFNGDIKKVIKWFNYLDEAGMLSDSAESDEEE